MDGKILVAGESGLSHDIVLLRYNSNDTVDQSFSTGGMVPTTFTGTFVVLQPDGRILAGGYTNQGNNN